MSEIVKVEISLVNGDWQWMGVLLSEDLELICKMADNLSDRAIDYRNATTPKEDKVA